MGPEEGGSVGSASASTGLFSGPDIAAQVQELEKRVTQQASDEAHIRLLLWRLQQYIDLYHASLSPPRFPLPRLD